MIDFLKCFYSYVQKTPERAAIVDRGGERRTSYAKLAEVSARLATWLLRDRYGSLFMSAFMIRPVFSLINGRSRLFGAYIGSRERAWRHYIAGALKDAKNIDKSVLFIIHAGGTEGGS